MLAFIRHTFDSKGKPVLFELSGLMGKALYAFEVHWFYRSRFVILRDSHNPPPLPRWLDFLWFGN